MISLDNSSYSVFVLEHNILAAPLHYSLARESMRTFPMRVVFFRIRVP